MSKPNTSVSELLRQQRSELIRLQNDYRQYCGTNAVPVLTSVARPPPRTKPVAKACDEVYTYNKIPLKPAPPPPRSPKTALLDAVDVCMNLLHCNDNQATRDEVDAINTLLRSIDPTCTRAARTPDDERAMLPATEIVGPELLQLISGTVSSWTEAAAQIVDMIVRLVPNSKVAIHRYPICDETRVVDAVHRASESGESTMGETESCYVVSDPSNKHRRDVVAFLHIERGGPAFSVGERRALEECMPHLGALLNRVRQADLLEARLHQRDTLVAAMTEILGLRTGKLDDLAPAIASGLQRLVPLDSGAKCVLLVMNERGAITPIATSRGTYELTSIPSTTRPCPLGIGTIVPLCNGRGALYVEGTSVSTFSSLPQYMNAVECALNLLLDTRALRSETEHNEAITGAVAMAQEVVPNCDDEGELARAICTAMERVVTVQSISFLMRDSPSDRTCTAYSAGGAVVDTNVSAEAGPLGHALSSLHLVREGVWVTVPVTPRIAIQVETAAPASSSQERLLNAVATGISGLVTCKLAALSSAREAKELRSLAACIPSHLYTAASTKKTTQSKHAAPASVDLEETLHVLASAHACDLTSKHNTVTIEVVEELLVHMITQTHGSLEENDVLRDDVVGFTRDAKELFGAKDFRARVERVQAAHCLVQYHGGNTLVSVQDSIVLLVAALFYDEANPARAARLASEFISAHTIPEQDEQPATPRFPPTIAVFTNRVVETIISMGPMCRRVALSYVRGVRRSASKGLGAPPTSTHWRRLLAVAVPLHHLARPGVVPSNLRQAALAIDAEAADIFTEIAEVWPETREAWMRALTSNREMWGRVDC
eukprot:PhM_4_TR16203/c0_g1_i1/m.42215